MEALKSLCEDKALGPDGFPMKFFKVFWPMLGEDVMNPLLEFHRKSALCRSLNATFISLIPKKAGATDLKDFKSISLISSFYKLLAKILARRLNVVMDKIISPY